MSQPIEAAPSEPAIGTRVRGIQLIVLSICTAINMLDGFDLTALAFTAPAIAKEWGALPTSLGFLFGVGLAGIALGSALLSPIADRYGRKQTILLGLALITVGMFFVPLAANVWHLGMLRLITGMGIGTLLASLNTIVAEYAPSRWRGLAISIYATGYPVGAMISGSVAFFVLQNYGWRAIYLIGSGASLLMIPVVLLLLPESLAFLLDRQPPDALSRARGIAARLGITVNTLPPKPAADRFAWKTLFASEHRATTIAISGAFLFLWMSSFFAQNWNPTVLAREGAGHDLITGSGVFLTLGGAVGSILFGLIATRADVRALTIAYLLLGSVAMVLFGQSAPGARALLLWAFFEGFFLVGVVVGLCAIAAQVFPTELRTSGTGFAMATGRIGAMLGVTTGGILIDLGWSRTTYTALLAVPALIATSLVVWLLRSKRARVLIE